MTDPRTTGATSVAKKRTIWPWALLALVVAGLLIWWLVAALTGDDDDTESSASPASTSQEATTTPEESESTGTPTETSASTSPGSVPVVVPAGAVLAGGIDVLDPDADLSGSIGDPVHGEQVQVRSAIADEAFYVGPEVGRTVLVRLQPFAGTGEPESPTAYEEGDTVTFDGTIEQVDQEFLSDLQLYDPSTQLSTGDWYVQASEVTVLP